MAMIGTKGIVGAALAAGLTACSTAPDAPQPLCLAACGEAPPELPSPVSDDAAAAGGWRQIVSYQPGPDSEGGVSIWIEEDAIVPGRESRETGTKEVRELWVNHGTARVAGQAYTLQTNAYHCGPEGGLERRKASAFTQSGDLLASVPVAEGIQSPVPHSAEFEIKRAVCSSNAIAMRGRAAPSVARVLEIEPAQAAPAVPVNTLTVDLDADGKPERLLAATRPHTMRLDVEIAFGAAGKRDVNILAAQQRPSGPLAEAKLRKAAPNAYLYACERVENRDATPCRPGEAKAFRGAVEVVVPSQPSLLIWLEDGVPRIVRLPAAAQ